MARGDPTYPLPHAWSSLCAWRELGGQITLTSDCHDRRYLAHAFPQAAALARQAGFRTALRLGTGDGAVGGSGSCSGGVLKAPSFTVIPYIRRSL